MLLTSLLFHCERDLDNTPRSDASATVAKIIPCTVENMQAAYDNLLANPTASALPAKDGSEQKSNGYVISTTHYYYRFLPGDATEYETLTADSVLSVSDTPFEVDIQDNGENYFDPGLAASGSEITYLYSVVPVGYPLPSSIQADRLAELHFTAEDEIGDAPTDTELQQLDFYYDLNLEALKISGHLDEEEKGELSYMDKDEPDPAQSIPYAEVVSNNIPFDKVIIDFSDIETFEKRRSWTPRGTVTVEEDALGFFACRSDRVVGVRTAEIKVRKWGWLVIRRGQTTKSGYFYTRSTKTKRVKYAVYFQPKTLKKFIVKAGTVFKDARHRGTNTYKRTSWQQHFSAGAYRSHFYALVHNAAADYTFDYAIPTGYGLHPVRNKIRISAKFNATGSNWSGFLHHPQTLAFPPAAIFNELFLSEVRVSRRGGNKTNAFYRGSDGIYATTVHELTHAGHYRMDKDHWSVAGLLDRKQRLLILESWAEGVETILTNDRYRGLCPDYINPGNENIGWNFERQEETVNVDGSDNNMDAYTPLFIDLNDDLNQRVVYSDPDVPLDRVASYSIRQMQESLDGARTLLQLRNALSGDHNNATEGNLEELFIYPNAVLNEL